MLCIELQTGEGGWSEHTRVGSGIATIFGQPSSKVFGLQSNI